MTTADRIHAGASARNDDHKEVGAPTMLLTELRMGWLLVEEARGRVVRNVFGVSGRESYLVTLIAAAVVAGAIREKSPIRRPATPSVSDAAIGAVVLREMAHNVAGDWSRETPYFVALVAGALLLKQRPLRRGVRASVRGVKTSSRRTRAALLGQYGRSISQSRAARSVSARIGC